jgi:indolepyruvate ferredoxin oxidoreductase
MIPLAYETLIRAIEMNAVAVDANKKAFQWGRAAAHDIETVKRIAFPDNVIELKRVASTLDEIVAKRVEFLTGYQNAAYAKRYAGLVERVRKVESDRLQSTRVTEAVARYYFKLLAYKDEYEVARLHSDPAFRAKIASQFEGNYKLNFYMAPPIISKPDPVSGKVAKKRFGPWMMTAFSLLAKMKPLRATPFDMFGYTAERRTERKLIEEYEATVEEILSRLSSENQALALQLASIPDEIRGYGHIKEGSLKVARIKWNDLLAQLRGQIKAQVINIAPRAA